MLIEILQSIESDGVSLQEFPHVEKWLEKLLARPSFKNGRELV